jgi:choline dehydrogenase
VSLLLSVFCSYADQTSLRILSQHGIETKVALPGVGEHLQDQPNVLLAYTGRTNITVTPYATFTTMHELFGTDVGPAVRANLTAWAASISAASNGAVSAHALERLFALQARLIFDQAVPSTELLTSGQGSIIYSAIWPLLPFSRGSVHIQSADATQPPAIDPRFFLVDFDLQATLAAARLVQRFWATQPVADLVVAQLLPAAATITPNATDAEWAEYIISACKSQSLHR